MPTLCILPERCEHAADNMAADMLLLESCSDEPRAFLRSYRWTEASATFGYTQQWDFASANAGNLPLTRRPTGGGLVDHSNDFTYSLILPCSHALARAHASESYRQVHEAIQEALADCGQQADLLPCPRASCADEAIPAPKAEAPTVCFSHPVVYDLCIPGTHEKIAGAAQKRTREGLLVQGSISRELAPPTQKADVFFSAFANTLAEALELTLTTMPWPSFTPERIAHWKTLFRSAQWLKRR